MIGSDAFSAFRVSVLAGGGQGASGSVVGAFGWIGPHLDVHATSDHFGHRDTQAFRPASNLAMLGGLKLYL
jgi:hypothetical protein